MTEEQSKGKTTGLKRSRTMEDQHWLVQLHYLSQQDLQPGSQEARVEVHGLPMAAQRQAVNH